MTTLELTLQHRRADGWPVVGELSRPGELARRCEGRLVFPAGCADLEGFAAALTERLDRPRDYGTLPGSACAHPTGWAAGTSSPSISPPPTRAICGASPTGAFPPSVGATCAPWWCSPTRRPTTPTGSPPSRRQTPPRKVARRRRLPALSGEIPHNRLGPVPSAIAPGSLDALTERITTGAGRRRTWARGARG
jgi:hypothetical protein